MNCRCNNIIPQPRLDLGYKTCINCSQVEAYGCIAISNHKTGNTIQVVAKEVADRVMLFDEGQLVEQNTPEEFFNNPESDRTKLFLSQIL